MKIECVKTKITDLTTKIERVASKNQNLPILSCFLLDAKNGSLSIAATNLDLGVCAELPVRVLSEGRAAVPASVIAGLLSQLPDEGTVSFEVVENKLLVSSKHSKTTIKLLPTDDFPSIPDVGGGEQLIVPAQDFIVGLQSVWYSAATSSMKPELSSVYINHNQNQLTFVATDSFRLSEKKIQTKKQADVNQILIPIRNVSDILRLFENNKEDIEVVFGKNQILFSVGGLRATSRLIEGVFPDYQQIIPKSLKTEAVVLKQDFLSALKSSLVFSGPFHKINLTVSPKKKLCELSSESEHVGKNLVQLDAAVRGEDTSISFNLRYLMDCFQSLQQDSISLGFNGSQKPLVIRGVGDSSFTYLVMPMNK